MQVLRQAQGHFTILSTLVSCFEPRTCIQCREIHTVLQGNGRHCLLYRIAHAS